MNFQPPAALETRRRGGQKKEWCTRIVDNPIRRELQPDGERVRFWGRVDEFENKVFRVVTLADETITHNAFPDRGFKE